MSHISQTYPSGLVKIDLPKWQSVLPKSEVLMIPNRKSLTASAHLGSLFFKTLPLQRRESWCHSDMKPHVWYQRDNDEKLEKKFKALNLPLISKDSSRTSESVAENKNITKKKIQIKWFLRIAANWRKK